MLGPNALIDWGYLQDMIPSLTEEDQEHYERLINTASGIANRYARRELKARDRTYIADGTDATKLILPHPPINTVTAVFIDTAGEFAAETEILDYRIDPEAGILIRKVLWPRGNRNVKVVYNSGYSDVPEDLAFAVAETVVYYHARMSNSLIGVKSMQSGEGYRMEHELTIPVNAQRVFEDYRDLV